MSEVTGNLFDRAVAPMREYLENLKKLPRLADMAPSAQSLEELANSTGQQDESAVQHAPAMAETVPALKD